jgi:radical SAM enzyme (TIGR01210 family)
MEPACSPKSACRLKARARSCCVAVSLALVALSCSREGARLTRIWTVDAFSVYPIRSGRADSSDVLISVDNSGGILVRDLQWGVTSATRVFDNGLLSKSAVGGLNSDTIWLTVVRHDSLFLVDVWPRRWMFVTSGPDVRPPEGWDGAASSVLLADIDVDDTLEAVVVVCTGFDRSPRGLFCLSWPSGRIKWRYPMGPNPSNLVACRMDGQRDLALVFGSTAPGNGNVVSTSSDTITYVTCLSSSGDSLWCRPVGHYGQQVLVSQVGAETGRDANLLACETSVPLNKAGTDSLWLLRPEDGTATESARAARAVGSFAVVHTPSGETRILVAGHDDTIRLYSASLALLRRRSLSGRGCLTMTPGMFLPGRPGVATVTVNGQLLLFDSDLNLLLRHPLIGTSYGIKTVRTGDLDEALLSWLEGGASKYELVLFRPIRTPAPLPIAAAFLLAACLLLAWRARLIGMSVRRVRIIMGHRPARIALMMKRMLSSRLALSLILFVATLALWFIVAVVLARFSDFAQRYQVQIGVVGGFLSGLTANVVYGLMSRRRTAASRRGLEITGIDWNLLLRRRSNLPKERKQEIVALLPNYYGQLVERRRIYLADLETKLKLKLLGPNSTLLSRPAWCSISTAHSLKGHRLSMGLRTAGCAYWLRSPDRTGCLVCGYCAGSLLGTSPTKQQILDQVEAGLTFAAKSRVDVDVVEFLNDGSFLNEDEITSDCAHEIFVMLANIEWVKRVLIETRPEHFQADRIGDLVDLLRDDQTLEVAFGVETDDEFVREACIRKGYGIRQFEGVLHKLARHRDRCRAVVYTLVKPPFLTEAEAIEDTVRTIKYASRISKATGVSVVPKLEPAVIPEATLLDILHFDVSKDSPEWYRPLSYWSVAEIIARAHTAGLIDGLRIGAREDMAIMKKVPAIYGKDGTFDYFDFWVYDAIQQFNIDHDILRLYAQLRVAYVDSRESFDAWQRYTGIGQPVLLRCLEDFEAEIDAIRKQPEQVKREGFLRAVFRVLDDIQTKKDSRDFARRLKHTAGGNVRPDREKVQEFVTDKFRAHMTEVVVDVRECYLEDDDRRMLRVYLQLTDLRTRKSHDIWVGIPTRETSTDAAPTRPDRLS